MGGGVRCDVGDGKQGGVWRDVVEIGVQYRVRVEGRGFVCTQLLEERSSFKLSKHEEGVRKTFETHNKSHVTRHPIRATNHT